MKATVVSSVVLLIAIASSASASATELKIVNKSKTALHHLYVSPASQKSWGQDRLGGGDIDTVEPGHKFSLHGIDPTSASQARC